MSAIGVDLAHHSSQPEASGYPTVMQARAHPAIVAGRYIAISNGKSQTYRHSHVLALRKGGRGSLSSQDITIEFPILRLRLSWLWYFHRL